MVAIGVDPVAGCCRVELPRLRSVDEQCAILAALAEAAATAELRSLVLAGFPPQVDERIAWTTVTPDPAVIEVNIAPSRNGRELLASLRTVYASAERLGLSSFQWRYNGDLADSGGGGHVTLGGPSPSASPFVAHPTLLARLVVYLNRHPALSYLFAGLGVGGSSQAPRCDEGSGEGIDELKLALAIIAARPDDVATVEVAWQMLAPFLTDRAGNPHRAEINVEKLWNPYLPGRGRSGLVELRALQMPATPERAVAIALLFATIVARLALAAPRPFELASWGDELHDRWSLPFHQRRDLADVVRDLAEHGFDLPAAIRDELFDDEHRMIGRAEIDGMRIEARRASEFWPLTHEASTENTGTSRLVDASTARTEVVLRPTSDATLAPLRALMHGRATELHKESDDSGPALVLGVRHRTFVPRPGLHPTLAPIDPLLIDLVRSDGGTWRVCIDAWRPGGGPYDGLPRTAAEAVRRRDERFRVERVAANQVRAAEDDTGSYVVDLRWPRQGP